MLVVARGIPKELPRVQLGAGVPLWDWREQEAFACAPCSGAPLWGRPCAPRGVEWAVERASGLWRARRRDEGEKATGAESLVRWGCLLWERRELLGSGRGTEQLWRAVQVGEGAWARPRSWSWTPLSASNGSLPSWLSGPSRELPGDIRTDLERARAEVCSSGEDAWPSGAERSLFWSQFRRGLPDVEVHASSPSTSPRTRLVFDPWGPSASSVFPWSVRSLPPSLRAAGAPRWGVDWWGAELVRQQSRGSWVCRPRVGLAWQQGSLALGEEVGFLAGPQNSPLSVYSVPGADSEGGSVRKVRWTLGMAPGEPSAWSDVVAFLQQQQQRGATPEPTSGGLLQVLGTVPLSEGGGLEYGQWVWWPRGGDGGDHLGGRDEGLWNLDAVSRDGWVPVALGGGHVGAFRRFTVRRDARVLERLVTDRRVCGLGPWGADDDRGCAWATPWGLASAQAADANGTLGMQWGDLVGQDPEWGVVLGRGGGEGDDAVRGATWVNGPGLLRGVWSWWDRHLPEGSRGFTVSGWAWPEWSSRPLGVSFAPWAVRWGWGRRGDPRAESANGGRTWLSRWTSGVRLSLLEEEDGEGTRAVRQTGVVESSPSVAPQPALGRRLWRAWVDQGEEGGESAGTVVCLRPAAAGSVPDAEWEVVLFEGSACRGRWTGTGNETQCRAWGGEARSVDLTVGVVPDTRRGQLEWLPVAPSGEPFGELRPPRTQSPPWTSRPCSGQWNSRPSSQWGGDGGRQQNAPPPPSEEEEEDGRGNVGGSGPRAGGLHGKLPVGILVLFVGFVTLNSALLLSAWGGGTRSWLVELLIRRTSVPGDVSHDVREAAAAGTSQPPHREGGGVVITGFVV